MGVVARRQAIADGLTRHAIAARLASGRWQRLHDGVYYTFTGPVPRGARLWAAVLRAGHGAVLSHETAAEVWKITDGESRDIHVSVPMRAGALKTPGIVLHHSARLPESRFPPALPPVTRAEDTVLDLAGSAATAEEAVAWAIKACQRRTTTPGLIGVFMTKRGRLRWRGDLAEALTEIRSGVESPLERRYLRDVERAHALPVGARQVRTRRGSRVQYHDVRYLTYNVCVELDGVAAHPADMRQRDIARDNSNTLHQIQTLRYGWSPVAYHPCGVAREVWTLLVQRGHDGAFRRCGRPECAAGERPTPGLARPGGGGGIR